MTFSLSGNILQADEFYEPFDAAKSTWLMRPDSRGLSLAGHARDLRAGQIRGGEVLSLTADRDGVLFELVHPLPVSRVLDDVTVRLWLKADRPGPVLGVRLVAPGVLDPSTGQPVETLITGDLYTRADKWQELTCRTTDRAVAEKMQLLRAQFQLPFEARQFQIDGVILGGRLSPGTIRLVVDELRAAPLVSVVNPATDAPANELAQPEVEFRLQRLQVQGKPFFPRIVAYQGEPPELLAELGFNLVWVPRYNDLKLLESLRQNRLWVAATPPHPQAETGATLDAGQAGLLPFTNETQPIALWMMGTRLSSSTAREPLLNWITQVQDADRHWQRPVAADVIDEELMFSRHVDLVGTSRHMLNTSFSYRDYLGWLKERRALAKPGCFSWTWLQLEPHSTSSTMVQVIEPEQLRLQAYSAIAAGCRGLGWWTTQPLSGTGPIARERQLAIQQINLELMLLEPWLATAGSITEAQLSCEIEPDGAVSSALAAVSNSASRALPWGRKSAPRNANSVATDLNAAMVRTDYGTVLFPLWLADQAQYCPSLSAARQVQLTVPGVGDFITAYQIETTGDIHTLDSKPVAGGRRLTLERFDMTAAILLTSDRSVIEQLKRRVSQIEPRAAKVAVELARLKFQRVGQTQELLQQALHASSESTSRLGQAKLLLERAEEALQRSQFALASQRSGETMQALRILQRLEWEAAVVGQTSAVSSPYSISYSTLPAHWELRDRYAAVSSQPTRKLLQSGDFEDFDTMLAEGWKHEQQRIPGLQAAGELKPAGFGGSRYALRLVASPAPGTDAQAVVLPRPPVMFTTPPLTAHAGQILRIRGQVQISRPITQSRDGLMLFDSLGGKRLALRWQAQQDWQPFELLRVVEDSQPFTVSLMLCGLGDVLVDNLTVEALASAPQGPVRQAGGTSGRNGLRGQGPRWSDWSPRPLRRPKPFWTPEP